MVTKYVDKYFINPAIENGIQSYILYTEGKTYPPLFTFEMNVIKVLTIIYGEKSILLPYKIDNEKAFECNLLMYDLKESDMKNFIKYMNEYYAFMKNYKSEKKATGLTTEIEKILLEMIIKRSKRKEFTQKEISEFDRIFNPIEGNLKKIKSLVSANNGLIVRAWENNKLELSNTQLRMIAVNPNLLDSNLYSKYGYNIKTIASLNEEEIEKINHVITIEENRINIEPEHKTIFKRGKIVFTTGNGFVDKLMLLSIIATELMIGVIIASIIGDKMEVKLNERDYQIVKNYRDGYDEEIVKEKVTEYFNDFDYIFGDWAYGKLRLKGFYKKDNKKVTKINNIEDLDKYIKNNCAYDCKCFLLEKKQG